MRDLRRSYLVWLALGLACSGKPSGSDPDNEDNGPPPPPVGQFAPLSPEDTKALLATLPPLPEETHALGDFVMRGASLPAPKPGQVLPFPAPQGPASAPVVESGPLSVLRYAPKGDISYFPNLSLTFSQPMAALGELNEPPRDQLPATLSPEPEGKWRWLGARTLLFEPKKRFPMATDYQVSVPAGSKALSGAALAAPLSFSFSTPAPTLTLTYPQPGEYSAPARPLVFLGFDQQIKPEAVQAALTGLPAGTLLRPVSLSPADLATRNPTIAAQLKSAAPGTFVLLEPDKDLPLNTSFTLTLPPGAYSAEGPKPNTAPQSVTFRTYGPLQFQKAMCGWDTRVCDPGYDWQLEFSNPLDPKSFSAAQVTVAPALEGFRCYVSGQYLNCDGDAKGRTTYTLSISAEIKDIFGQTLGANASASLTTGPAQRTLEGPNQSLLVLDPASGGKFSIHTTNFTGLEVTLQKVGPEHWTAFGAYSNFYSYSGDPRPPLPGTKVSSKKVEIVGPKDERNETVIDISEALKDGLGQVLVHITPTDPLPAESDYNNPNYYYGTRELNLWVQGTALGLDALAGPDDLLVFVQNLADGKPRAGVELSLFPGGQSVKSDADGLGSLLLPSSGFFSSGSTYFLVARQGDDIALLTPNPWPGAETGWRKRERRDELAWHVFDDRALYKPGEEAHIKGIVRLRRWWEKTEITAFDATEIKYTAYEPRGNKIAEGKAPISKLGGFSFSVKLPDEANLGYARIELEANGAWVENRAWSHSLRIEEFRRPEFEVKASAPDGPFFAGTKSEATVRASYYAGGPLPGAEVTWDASFSATSFTPPNQDGYSFGDYGAMPYYGYGYGFPEPDNADAWKPLHEEGVTNAAGEHVLALDLAPRGTETPYNVSASVTVMDLNRQAWYASTSLLVHPSDRYVGLKSDKPFGEKGEPFEISSLVVDLDGKPIPGRAIELTITRSEWGPDSDGTWKQKELDPETAKLTSGQGPQPYTFTPKKGGTYKVRAVVTDEQGRKNASALSLWVAGDDETTDRTLQASEIRLSLDQPEYKAGQTAKLLLASPFYPAEGLLTVQRDGIVSRQRFTMTKTTTTLEIPIESAWAPNAYAAVLLVGAQTRGQDSPGTLPAYAYASVQLSVPISSQKLAVTVKPKKKELAPGSKTSFTVSVKDATGKPVKNAEVAVLVVDEAILSLAGISAYANPLDAFFPCAGRVSRLRSYGPSSGRPSDRRRRCHLRRLLLRRRTRRRSCSATDSRTARSMHPPKRRRLWPSHLLAEPTAARRAATLARRRPSSLPRSRAKRST